MGTTDQSNLGEDLIAEIKESYAKVVTSLNGFFPNPKVY